MCPARKTICGANRDFHPGVLFACLVLTAMLWTGAAKAASDPGVRSGPAGAGGPLPGLTALEKLFFDAGLEEFLETQSVQGTIEDTELGLGPGFNLNQCAGCHLQPAVGGTSPLPESLGGPGNPQVAVATLDGATNEIGPTGKAWFIVANGPVREARFKNKVDVYGNLILDSNNQPIPDGGVTNVFVITNRVDAPLVCQILQQEFRPAGIPLTGQPGPYGNQNVIFRIPTPVFGLGLIEMITDSALIANRDADLTTKTYLGISGRENREGNTGTITRIGWKAQNKSGLIFSGEAYNVEQGVTNEMFQDERNQTDPDCLINPLPEDVTSFSRKSVFDILSSIEQFSIFMRLLAPPAPVTTDFTTLDMNLVTAASVDSGRALFNTVGCNLCHTPTLTTGTTEISALSNQPVNLFSDILLHDMGSGLEDGINQGVATGREFRTAPLWGIGQRGFFLHDGRTSDLREAILAHASTGSEANAVIAAFNALTDAEKQDILNFLRSL